MSTFLATIISSSVKKSHIWTSDTSSRVSILLRMNARTSLITTLQAQIVAISVESDSDSSHKTMTPRLQLQLHSLGATVSSIVFRPSLHGQLSWRYDQRSRFGGRSAQSARPRLLFVFRVGRVNISVRYRVGSHHRVPISSALIGRRYWKYSFSIRPVRSEEFLVSLRRSQITEPRG
ncbi:uncharacterized protein LOC143920852 isoform X2 [Arctopsyche grandis]